VPAVVELAARLDLPVVATHDVCFLTREEFEAHETRVCIQEGRTLNDPRRIRRYSDEQYLKSAEEMARLFADLPEALENTVEIAKRCNAALSLGTNYLPNYPVPGGESLGSFLARVAREGLDARLGEIARRRATPVDEAAYRARLDEEIRIIDQMGYPGYFLIVMEFIQWAKREGIPVGPGRGSGAGSLVAYALGITDLDPIEYDLLFERFLNPERVSLPDFDVDFCMERRDEVIAHVADLYGHDAVSQIITFGTMAAKAVVRDVARVQGKSYGLADKLSKLIPFEVGMTLERAVAESAELRSFIEADEEVGEIMEMAYRLEGVVRNVGKHAGGVVIAPSRLTDYVPLYVDEASGGLVTQFDKDDVERAGLVKFDFLGLKTLTIIDWAVAAINAKSGSDGRLAIAELPLDDPATFALLARADTTAVFQLESRGMKDLIRRLLPDRFEDIIALVALFRPGPLQSGMVDDFIDRKHGRARVEYPHAALEPVLRNTYGVILYQEQVMQIAQVLAGFTLGQADLLRRAMGKKKPEEMAQQRARFTEGATARGVDERLATSIFDLMEKFAGYGFNKSHSAAYALVSYQTAWLKAHHPAEFMAAVLSADMQHTDKIVTLVDEVRRMGLVLEPPNVNQSAYRFSVTGERILYGLGAVKGVGENAVLAICEARAVAPFTDLYDFCGRIDARKANRRVLEALIRAGAMDVFASEGEGMDAGRARLLAELDEAMHAAEQAAHNAASGIADLFGGADASPARGPVRVQRPPPLTRRERLEGEKETLGLYLTGHPIDDYLGELRSFLRSPIAELRAERGPQAIAGLVVSVRTMRSKRGDTMAFIVLDDRSGRIEVSVFGDVYEPNKHKLYKDAIVVAEGEVQHDEYTQQLKMRANALSTMLEARSRFADWLEIRVDAACGRGDLGARLRRLLEPHRRTGCRVAVRYRGPEAEGRLVLGADWRVAPSDDLLAELRDEFGADGVDIAYRRAG
jgi:DNA polymerase-3 subunit alpha